MWCIQTVIIQQLEGSNIGGVTTYLQSKLEIDLKEKNKTIIQDVKPKEV